MKIPLKIANFLFPIIAICAPKLSITQNHITSTPDNPEFYKTIVVRTARPQQLLRKTKRFRRNFQNKGFLGFSIDSINTRQKHSTLYLYTGPKFYLDSIEVFYKNSPLPKYYYSSNQPRKYKIKKVLNIENKIIEHYQNQGYPFITLDKDTKINTNNIINHNITINPGNHFVFGKLIIPSISQTEIKYLSGITGIKEGKDYQKKLIADFAQKINKSESFTLDSISVSFIDDTVYISPIIKRENSNSISGLAGLQSINNKTVITGQIQIKTNNLLKTGEKIEINWNKPAESSQRLDLSTEFQYLIGTPIGVGLDFMIEKRDSTFLNQHFKTGVIFNLNPKSSITTYYSVTNSSSLQTNNETLLAKQSTYGLYYNTQISNLLSIPESKFDASINFQLGSRKADNTSNIYIANTFFKLQKNLTIGSIHFSQHLGYIFNDSITHYELFQIGGTKTIRGFSEGSIFAKSYSISSLEYRFHLNKLSFINLFYDYGLTAPSININYDTRQAIGIGISVKTNPGTIQLSYALGKINTNNFLLNKGIIHLNYIAAF